MKPGHFRSGAGLNRPSSKRSEPPKLPEPEPLVSFIDSKNGPYFQNFKRLTNMFSAQDLNEKKPKKAGFKMEQDEGGSLIDWPPDNGSSRKKLPGEKSFTINGKGYTYHYGEGMVDASLPPSADQSADYNYGYYLWRKHENGGDGLAALEEIYKLKDSSPPSLHEAALAVLAALPLSEIVEIGPDKIKALVDFPDPEFFGKIKAIASAKSKEEFLNSKERGMVAQAQDNLASVLPTGIKAAAAQLSHEDPDAIRQWGKALDAARVEALGALKKEGFVVTDSQSETKGSRLTQDLKAVITAKKPTGLRAIWAALEHIPPNVRITMQREMRIVTHTATPDDYRHMSPKQKAERANKILSTLKTLYEGDVARLEDEIAEAQSAQETALLYTNITRAYVRGLKENRERIIEAERAALQSHVSDQDDDASLLRAGFESARSIEQDIDKRIEALEESLAACIREEKLHEARKALLEGDFERKQSWLTRSLPALQAQYDTAQLQALHHEAALDAQAMATLNALKPKHRDQARWELAMAPVLQEVEALLEAQVEQEKRMITAQSPTALLEYRETLAIPDLRDEKEQEPMPASEKPEPEEP